MPLFCSRHMLLTAYALSGILLMTWIIEFHDEFDP
jgi:hypothetical protein